MASSRPSNPRVGCCVPWPGSRATARRSSSTTHHAAYAGSQTRPSAAGRRGVAAEGVVRRGEAGARSRCRSGTGAACRSRCRGRPRRRAACRRTRRGRPSSVSGAPGCGGRVQLREPGADPGEVREPREDPPGTCAGRRGRPPASQSRRGRCAQRLSSSWPGSAAQSGSLGWPSRRRSRSPGRRPSRRRSRARGTAGPARPRGRRRRPREPGQRGRGAADPLVAGGGVVLEDQALGPRPGEVAGVPVGQEAPVPVAGQPDGRGVAVVDRPADVVVAADVGDPGAGDGRRRQRRRACRARTVLPVASIDQTCTIRLLW